jgi:hypothetical protein
VDLHEHVPLEHPISICNARNLALIPCRNKQMEIDMIITGEDYDGIKLLKAESSHHFAMRDLGLIRYFLGIEVASSPKGYLLPLSKYIADLFDLAKMVDSSSARLISTLSCEY